MTSILNFFKATFSIRRVKITDMGEGSVKNLEKMAMSFMDGP
jgi:hypothetical protein